MGGILLRQYLQHERSVDPGKIVMLAPPNHGSELADALKGQFWYPWILGPAAMELGTDASSLPNRLAPVPGNVGVIAGTGSSPPWFGWVFDGEHDGKVAVASTRLPEMSDFLLVEQGHTVMIKNAVVIEQVLFFLRHGRFAHGNPVPGSLVRDGEQSDPAG